MAIFLTPTCQGDEAGYVRLLGDPIFVFGNPKIFVQKVVPDKKVRDMLDILGPTYNTFDFLNRVVSGRTVYDIYGTEVLGTASIGRDRFTVNAGDMKPERRVRAWSEMESSIMSFVKNHWPAVSPRALPTTPRNGTGLYHLEFAQRREGLDIRELSIDVCCWNGKIANLEFYEDPDWVDKPLPPMPPQDNIKRIMIDHTLVAHPEFKNSEFRWVDLHRHWSRPDKAMSMIGTIRADRNGDTYAIGVVLTDDLMPSASEETVQVSKLPRPRPPRAPQHVHPFPATDDGVGWITDAPVAGFPDWSKGHESVVLPLDGKVVALRPLLTDLYSFAHYEKITVLPSHRMLITGNAVGGKRKVYLVDLATKTAIPLAKNIPEHYDITSLHTVFPREDIALAVVQHSQTRKSSLNVVPLSEPKGAYLVAAASGPELNLPVVALGGLLFYVTHETNGWRVWTAKMTRSDKGKVSFSQMTALATLETEPIQMECTDIGLVILGSDGNLSRLEAKPGGHVVPYSPVIDVAGQVLRIRSLCWLPKQACLAVSASPIANPRDVKIYSVPLGGVAHPFPLPMVPTDYFGDIQIMDGRDQQDQG